MSKVTVRGTGQIVSLTKGNFVAKGGEGSIHIIGDTVYKDSGIKSMIPDGKFTELAVLDHPAIIVPEDVLLNKNNKPCGYTMRAVPNKPIPLAQILTKGYRQREGVTPDHMMELVTQMMSGLSYIHSKKGYFQVDGNELNYMVTGDYKEVYFIDTNSYAETDIGGYGWVRRDQIAWWLDAARAAQKCPRRLVGRGRHMLT